MLMTYFSTYLSESKKHPNVQFFFTKCTINLKFLSFYLISSEVQSLLNSYSLFNKIKKNFLNYFFFR